MISAFPVRGCLPAATAYCGPAMKVYQPLMRREPVELLATSRVGFSPESSSRASSSVPGRTHSDRVTARAGVR